MEKYAISQDGTINQRLVFDNRQKSFEKYKCKEGEIIVPVWEFAIWFRQHDDKDFVMFYSAKEDIAEATDEAIEQMRSSFAIVSTSHGTVAKYGKNLLKEALC